jgi:hypothetical protein
MPLARLFAVLAAAIVLAGCLPVTSKTPVGTTTGLSADPALFGTWKGKNPQDKDQRDGTIHFMQAKEGGFDIVVVLAEGSRDDGWTAFTASSARLGDHHFLNATMTYDKGIPAEGRLKGAVIPLLYVRSGRTLTLYQIDEAAAKAAIQAGKINGTIAPGDNGDVTITADAAELDRFMARPGAAMLFQPMLVLKRAD